MTQETSTCCNRFWSIRMFGSWKATRCPFCEQTLAVITCQIIKRLVKRGQSLKTNKKPNKLITFKIACPFLPERHLWIWVAWTIETFHPHSSSFPAAKHGNLPNSPCSLPQRGTSQPPPASAMRCNAATPSLGLLGSWRQAWLGQPGLTQWNTNGG